MRLPVGLWRGGFCLALALAWGLGLAVAPAWAQGVQTGVLAGEVVDDGGASLEGVSAAVAGGSVERTAVTDAQGRFRFPALPEGGYSVEAELLGLVAEETATVYIGMTTELRLALSPAGSAAEPEGDDDATVEESIQMVALAPLLDPYDLRVGITVRASFLDDLPVERIY